MSIDTHHAQEKARLKPTSSNNTPKSSKNHTKTNTHSRKTEKGKDKTTYLQKDQITDTDVALQLKSKNLQIQRKSPPHSLTPAGVVG